jgi:hypothetical protein
LLSFYAAFTQPKQVFCGSPINRNPLAITPTKMERPMPRYMVERAFKDGLHIPTNKDGANVCGGVIARNGSEGVTWVQSFVSADKSKTFCIYDAPNPEAIRKTAEKNQLPVNAITEVQVLDPYFYH